MAMQEIKERPIIFSGEMIRQILAGNQTQTRQVVKVPAWLAKMQPNLDDAFADKAFGVTPCLQVPCSDDGFGTPDKSVQRLRNPWNWPEPSRLWVQEAWSYGGASSCGKNHGLRVTYHADNTTREIFFPTFGEMMDSSPNQTGFKPSNGYEELSDDEQKWEYDDWITAWWKRQKNKAAIYMPRWASRLTIEITNVRVERFQDISEEDAMAEGYSYNQLHAIAPFSWVWAIEFQKVSGKPEV